MEQRQYFPKAQKRKLKRERIKKWFSETFRAHSKEEYKEFFTRGFDGQTRLNTVYPWVYMRMLVLCFLLFAATTFFMRITGNAISFPTMILLGAVFVNLPFVTLIYELCPETDLSFTKLMFVLIIGGLASVILTELGYWAFIPENGYASVAWTAFVEEMAKAIPAIVIILILKKRKSPLACFAVAAAVGAGISIMEDMGYILFNSYDGTIELSVAITTSVLRSISGIATHTVWVGYVGWIFSKCKKPLIDVRFYAILLMSMVLHFLWDLIAANEQTWSLVGMLFGFIFCICFTRWLVKKERKLILEAPEVLPLTVSAAVAENEVAATATEETVVENVEVKPNPAVYVYTVRKEFPEETLEIKIKKWKRYSQAANIIAAVAAIILGIQALNFCAVSYGYGREVKTFMGDQKQQFLDYVQCGYSLTYDWDRPLDKSVPVSEWYAFNVSGGVYTQITQIVDGKYYYSYEWYYNWLDSANNEGENNADVQPLDYGWRFPDKGEWYLCDISVEIDGETYACIKVQERSVLGITTDDAETEELSCYIVREDVLECYREGFFGTYNVVTENVVFYGIEFIIIYSIIAGLIIFVGGMLFTVLKLNSRKLAKQIAAATEAEAEKTTADVEENSVEENGVEEVISDKGENGDVE